MRNARGWRAAQLCAACLVVAGCSSEPEVTAPTLELSTTTFTTLPPTTTTTEAPTTTEDPRIAEVEAAVAAARQLQVELLKSETRPVEELQAFLTGRALESATESTLLIRADGQEVRGEFSGSPVSTTIEGSGAVHIQCGLDAVGSFDGDSTIVAPDEIAFLLRYELDLDPEDGRWRVELVRFDGGEQVPCEL